MIQHVSEHAPATYTVAIQTAADLIGERENFTLDNDYTRGICETLGDMWGRPGVELADRKLEVLNDMIAYFNQYNDPHGTIHPDWNGGNHNRFKIWVRGHEPEDSADWHYKLEVIDTKYQDSDGLPISAIAGGTS